MRRRVKSTSSSRQFSTNERCSGSSTAFGPGKPNEGFMLVCRADEGRVAMPTAVHARGRSEQLARKGFSQQLSFKSSSELEITFQNGTAAGPLAAHFSCLALLPGYTRPR